MLSAAPLPLLTMGQVADLHALYTPELTILPSCHLAIVLSYFLAFLLRMRQAAPSFSSSFPHIFGGDTSVRLSKRRSSRRRSPSLPALPVAASGSLVTLHSKGAAERLGLRVVALVVP